MSLINQHRVSFFGSNRTYLPAAIVSRLHLSRRIVQLVCDHLDRWKVLPFLSSLPSITALLPCTVRVRSRYALRRFQYQLPSLSPIHLYYSQISSPYCLPLIPSFTRQDKSEDCRPCVVALVTSFQSQKEWSSLLWAPFSHMYTSTIWFTGGSWTRLAKF